MFALNNSELSYTNLLTNLVQHCIETGDVEPIQQHARRIPFGFVLCKKVNEMVQDMSEEASLWASPIVLVAKPDGIIRFCVDYRKLNSIIKMDVFPLQRIDDSIYILSHSRYFSTLDLIIRSGYWQVKILMAPGD